MVIPTRNLPTRWQPGSFEGSRWGALGGALIVALSLLALPVSAQNQGSSSARESFIELSADKAELYVQEQLLLTVQLYFSSELMRGELSEPVSNNAVIESLGPQQEYSRVRGDQRYRMIERRYAVYPQTAGQLSLAPIEFEGLFQNANGRPRILRNSEQLYDLPVKDIPPQFSGKVWLPATALTLEESGLPDDNRVTSGANLTRQLTLRASGLPDATLPPFPDQTAPGLRFYPEPAKRATDINAAGLSSTLQQSSALVPVQAGELSLPELRIPWWDTANDSEKVAIIRARRLTVAPGFGTHTQALPDAAAEQGISNPPGHTEIAQVTNDHNFNGDFWPWLALFMAVGWGVTAVLFWRTRRSLYVVDNKAKSDAEPKVSELYSQLLAAAGNTSADTPRLLLRWMNLRHPGKHFQSWRQIAEFCQMPQLGDALAELEQRRYSSEQCSEYSSEYSPELCPEHTAPPSKSRLASQLKQAVRELADRPVSKTAETGLTPLYPPTLSSHCRRPQ